MALDNAELAEKEAWRLRAVRMRDLLSHPEWEDYCKELEELEKDATERMIAGSDDHHYLRGRVQGLREACYRPAWIIEHVRKAYTNG